MGEELEGDILEGIINMSTPGYTKDDTVHTSSLGFCMRKSYLTHILNKGVTLNGAMLYGKMFHHALPEILKDIPEFYFAKYDTKLTHKLEYGTLAGHPDIYTPNKIWEVKTTDISRLKFSGVPQSYYTQANTYCGMAGYSEYGLIVVDSKVVFDKKGTLDLGSVVVINNEFDELVYEMHLYTAQEIDTAIHDNPEQTAIEFSRPCPSFKVECSSCPVRGVCERLYEEGEDSN